MPSFKLNGRVVEKSGDQLKLPSRSGDDRMEKKVVADEAVFEGIGPVTGEFYVYDRDREVRRRLLCALVFARALPASPRHHNFPGFLVNNG